MLIYNKQIFQSNYNLPALKSQLKPHCCILIIVQNGAEKIMNPMQITDLHLRISSDQFVRSVTLLMRKRKAET